MQHARSRFASARSGDVGAASVMRPALSARMRPTLSSATPSESTLLHAQSTNPPRSARTANASARPTGQRPVLPMCYLCGQQFGTTSIAIHIPQCYTKRLAQWTAADPTTRGKPPRHPDTVNWRGDETGQSAQEQNDAQFREFVANLEPCPHCGRRFAADRLVVHLRSCRPGNTARPIHPTSSPSQSHKSLRPSGNNSSNSSEMGTRAGITCEDAYSRSEDSDAASAAAASRARHHPRTNRLPAARATRFDESGRRCAACQTVEYDDEVNECGTCAAALPMIGAHSTANRSHNSPSPANNTSNKSTAGAVCASCHAVLTSWSPFCGMCGQPMTPPPLNNPPSDHSTKRTSPTPATTSWKATRTSRDDVTAQEPVGHDSGTRYCPQCRECVEDETAVYCEECGQTLVTQPNHNHNTSHDASAQPNHGGPQARRGVTSSGGRGRSPSSPQALSHTVDDHERYEDEADMNMTRVMCRCCGRSFAADALSRHERVCATVQQRGKKRRVFDTTRKRLSGLGEEMMARASGSGRGGGAGEAQRGNTRALAAGRKRDWRAESEEFRRTLRAARQVDAALKSGAGLRHLPPPVYRENPDYVPCPHCSRRFAPDVAERHIPRCAATVHRPKPPPRRG